MKAAIDFTTMSWQLLRPHPFRRPLALAVIAVALGGSGAALAQAGPGEGMRLTPAQRQKIFPEQKRLALTDHQARIAILQNGERCLAAAGSGEALRDCMKEQRNAMQRQRELHRSAMKALLESNGIAMPAWGKGEGRWSGGEGRAGSIGI